MQASKLQYKTIPTMPKGSLREAALWYAEVLGWKIFPVEPHGKKPITAHGLLDASSDPLQIEAWWESFPNANIGVSCGQASGIYVVDIDTKDDGDKTWIALEALHPEHETLIQQTGSGGFHLIYKAPEFELGNSAKKLGEGIDTRGDGGYIIVPPSIHENGMNYKWVTDDPIAELPSWVADTLRQKKVDYEPIDYIGEGERNDTMARIAGALRNIGLGEDGIYSALVGINDSIVMDTPLDDSEVQSIAHSIARYEPGTALKSVLQEKVAQAYSDIQAAKTHFLTTAELVDMELPPTNFLIEGLIDAGTFGIIHGIPGTFKSFVALELAFLISGGGYWLDEKYEVNQTGRVAYFWQDDSEFNEMKRVQEYIAAGNIDKNQQIDWYLNKGFGFSEDPEKDDTQLMRDLIIKHGYTFIVLDSLYDFNHFKSAKLKDEDFAIALARIKSDICDGTGCTVAIVDHSAWGSDHSYGSVFKTAALRWEMGHKKIDDTLVSVKIKGNNMATSTLTVRYDEIQGKVVLATGQDFDNISTTTLVLRYTPEQEEVALTPEELLNLIEEYCEETEIPVPALSAVKMACTRLYKEGKLDRDGIGVKGKPSRYWRSME